MDKIQQNKYAAIVAGAVAVAGLAYLAMPGGNKLKRSAKTKYGRYTRSTPWGHKGTFMKALAHAEAKHGRPVYLIEIAQSWPQVSWKPYFAVVVLHFIGADLYQNDEVLCDQS